MRYLKWIVMLLAMFVFSQGHAVYAGDFEDLGTFDPYHNFTITFNKEVDEKSIHSITVLDEKYDEIETGGIYLSEDPRKVIVPAPKGGYKDGSSYYLLIPSVVESIQQQNLTDTITARFTVQSEKTYHISGDIADFDEKSDRIWVQQEGKFEELQNASTYTYDLQMPKNRQPLSYEDLIYSLKIGNKYKMDCNWTSREKICTLLPTLYKERIVGFARESAGAAPYAVILRMSNKKETIELQMDDDSIYYEDIAWGEREIDVDRFIDRLGYSDLATVQYELKNGVATFHADIELLTGVFNYTTDELINPNFIRLHADGATYTHMFPIGSDTEYYQQVEEGRKVLSKSDFLSALWMGKTYVTYQGYTDPNSSKRFHRLFLREENPITSGKFAGFIGNAKEVKMLVLLSDGDSAIKRVALSDQGVYFALTNEFPQRVSKAYFINAFSLNKGMRVTYMIKNGLPHYVMWNPLGK